MLTLSNGLIAAGFAFLLGTTSVNSKILNQCKEGGTFAMTWDGGPGDYTQQLLNILDKRKVKVTFHLTTQYLTDPNVQHLVQKIAGAGHLIGLSVENWNLFQMSSDQITGSLARQASVMENFIGYYPKFIRLPYKGYNDNIIRAIESTGAVITAHNVETFDSTGNANRIKSAFQLNLSLTGRGGRFISVQHDSTQQSVAVTDDIIGLILSKGYKMVTLDKCLGMGDMTKNTKPLEGADDDGDPIVIDGAAPMPEESSGQFDDSGMTDPSMGDDESLGTQGSNDANSLKAKFINAALLVGAVIVVLMA